jgi:hypothetical protein
MDRVDVDAVAEELVGRACSVGQAVLRTDAATPVTELRTAVRRAARARGVAVRTGMVDDVLAVVRADAPLWDASTAEMRRALSAPDEPGVVG